MFFPVADNFAGLVFCQIFSEEHMRILATQRRIFGFQLQFVYVPEEAQGIFAPSMVK
jgi:hypothetical protein